MTDLIIKPISVFPPELLSGFSHRQKWVEQWVVENGAWVLVPRDQFHEWSDKKRRWIPGYLKAQADRGGRVFGAYSDEKLVGFVSHDASATFGGTRWVNLTMLFVDDSFKRRGVGKALFAEIVKNARDIGAEKVFISAVPSRETVAFYFAVGCVDASVVIPDFVDTEEDRYLEYDL